MVVPVLRKTGGSKPLPTHYVPAADTCLQWRMPVDVGLLGEKFPKCSTEPPLYGSKSHVAATRFSDIFRSGINPESRHRPNQAETGK